MGGWGVRICEELRDRKKMINHAVYNSQRINKTYMQTHTSCVQVKCSVWAGN